MENTNLDVVVELETPMTIIGKAYNVSDKKKVSMLGTVRTEIRTQTLANLESINLSEYELVDNKFLVKKIAECGTTKEPVYLKFELTYTNIHPSNLAKKGKTKTESGKAITVYPSINL